MYTVLIADDYDAICNGIAELIRELFPQLKIIGVCSYSEDILRILETEVPDIIITDIRMPDINGLEICKSIRKTSSRTKIILISGYKEFEYAKQAVDLGAMAYLVKPYPPRELVHVISRAIQELEIADSSAQPVWTNVQEQTLSASIIQFLEKNYSNPELSLGMVAKHFNVNYTYASEVFAEEVGVSINAFINNLRCLRAIDLMRCSPDYTMEQIATSVGYSNSSYFSKIFKSKYGVTPSQYRKNVNVL